jgi:hypothetical protein
MRRFAIPAAARRLLAGLSLALCIGAPAQADETAWEPWQHVLGVVDVGVRADGSLVAMAAGRLYLVSRGGALSPFADGVDGYRAGNPDAESYFVVARALNVETAGCNFTADDLFVLDLSSPPGIAQIDATGRATRLATLGGVDTLGGIAIDTTGAFGHRLLVTGTHDGNKTTVFAVDCRGGVTVLTDAAPPLEGGIEVAPATFGRFAGSLVAPDENTGQMWAIDPAGIATLITIPNLPTGGDTGVESVGFVPPGFSAGGAAYLADRGTANNPFPGPDSILRLSSAALVAAGVQDGDLLVSIEGGGTTVAIHCESTCSVSQPAQGTRGGHIEGHIVFQIDPPGP